MTLSCILSAVGHVEGNDGVSLAQLVIQFLSGPLIFICSFDSAYNVYRYFRLWCMVTFQCPLVLTFLSFSSFQFLRLIAWSFASKQINSADFSRLNSCNDSELANLPLFSLWISLEGAVRGAQCVIKILVIKREKQTFATVQLGSSSPRRFLGSKYASRAIFAS